jgi:Tfp pilus assembly protein PilW
VTLYWPRAVLDNGRTYFNSFNPLVNGDSNGTWDVYQYEPFGAGDCDPSAGNGMVATTETGCVGLISSGSDSLPSGFMDSSASGDDVFFVTYGRLSPLDNDEAPDVYDARVNGVQAVAEQHTECSGQACQQRGLPPGEPAPNSSTFNGAGNLKAKHAKHCRHGKKKVRRKGKVRCVPRSRSHRHGKHGGSR